MNIYSPELEQIIAEYHYIPRMFRYKEKFKLYHKYWIPEFTNTVIKVIDISFIDDIEYYFIKYDDGKMYGCIPYPIEYNVVYELLHNYDNLEDQNIVNSDISYTGAEIRYWFIINDKLKPDILTLIDLKSELVDNHKYFIYRKKKQYFLHEDSGR